VQIAVSATLSAAPVMVAPARLAAEQALCIVIGSSSAVIAPVRNAICERVLNTAFGC
jgi:hypothetical protein